LTPTLLEAGLVEELQLCVALVLHMKGRRPFDRGWPRRLTLTRSVTSRPNTLLDFQVVGCVTVFP
jgi:hypothetical protein